MSYMKVKKPIVLIFILICLISVFIIKKNSFKPSISNIVITFDDYIQPKEEVGLEQEHGLVDLTKLPTNFLIELRYATTNNFAKKLFYPKIAKPYLKESTAQKLMEANEEFFKLGYKIKILDAYRPHKYQFELRKAASEINSQTQGYIANPDTGSHHNRGVSVDITLTDLNGSEINMPTEYDHFGPEASITYSDCTEEEKNNRELLGTIMEKHGFRRINSEWWHFDDTDYLKYPILEVDFVDLYDL